MTSNLGRKLNFRGLCISLLFLTISFPFLPLASASDPVHQSVEANCPKLVYSKDWVKKENEKSGDGNWNKLVKNEAKGHVSGWFSETSAACGENVGLHLSGNDRQVKVSIYRMGYYAGTTARLVFSEGIGRVPAGAPPTVSQDQIHLTTTNWPTTTTIHIDENYPTGIYMARFDDGGEPGYAPLIIRSNTPQSDLVMVAATMTWQAYNTWGGWSLYHGPNPITYSPGRIVSFNRPYDRDGKSNFTVNDAGIVQSAESLGLNISYTDDVYLSAHPKSLLGHASVIYDGHTEYWTNQMHEAAFRARDSGVNLLFLGANSAYWRTRLENNGRLIVCWKGSPDDPFSNDPKMITNKWGEIPNASNESELLGALMAGIGVEADYTVNDSKIWPLAGTGLISGQTIFGVVGKEVETTDIGIAPAVQTFLTSRVKIHGTWYNIHLSYYTTASNSGVIDVGTNGWVCTMTSSCTWKSKATSESRSQLRSITANILAAGAIGPLALLHPEVSDIPAKNKLEEICIKACEK